MSDAGMQPPDGPPVCAALNLWPPGIAAADVFDDLAQRGAHRDLDEARVVDLAAEREHFVPGLFSVPMLRNHAGPLRKICGIFAYVSTLLRTVGFWKRPLSAGNGGAASRLAALALDGGHQRRLLAADERALARGAARCRSRSRNQRCTLDRVFIRAPGRLRSAGA